MPRLSINEITTFRWTFEEDLAAYQAAGIQAMGVWRQKLSDCGEEKAIDLYEVNAARAAAGVYDEWVANSFAQLAVLMPARYAKFEKVESYVATLY